MMQQIQKFGLEVWLEKYEGISLIGQKVMNIGNTTAYLVVLSRKTNAEAFRYEEGKIIKLPKE